jgi:hypothetical protein
MEEIILEEKAMIFLNNLGILILTNFGFWFLKNGFGFRFISFFFISCSRTLTENLFYTFFFS